MTEKFSNAYQKFLNEWGEQSQIMMAIEEMSELTKELCKYYRFKNYNEKHLQNASQNVREEIADVLNCVEQLELIFGAEQIEKIRQEKIDRTLKRVEKDGY